MASEVRFAEIRKLLERAGYQLVRVSGSHHIFAKSGKQLLSIPVLKGRVKPFYVRQIQHIIEEG